MKNKLKSLFCKHQELFFFGGMVDYSGFEYKVMFCADCGRIVVANIRSTSGEFKEFFN